MYSCMYISRNLSVESSASLYNKQSVALIGRAVGGARSRRTSGIASRLTRRPRANVPLLISIFRSAELGPLPVPEVLGAGARRDAQLRRHLPHSRRRHHARLREELSQPRARALGARASLASLAPRASLAARVSFTLRASLAPCASLAACTSLTPRVSLDPRAGPHPTVAAAARVI